MREASGPAMEPLPVTAHLLQPVIERAARDPGRPVAAYRDGDRFVDVTAGELLRARPPPRQGPHRVRRAGQVTASR